MLVTKSQNIHTEFVDEIDFFLTYEIVNDLVLTRLINDLDVIVVNGGDSIGVSAQWNFSLGGSNGDFSLHDVDPLESSCIVLEAVIGPVLDNWGSFVDSSDYMASEFKWSWFKTWGAGANFVASLGMVLNEKIGISVLVMSSRFDVIDQLGVGIVHMNSSILQMWLNDAGYGTTSNQKAHDSD
jgi:hypothetical protein